MTDHPITARLAPLPTGALPTAAYPDLHYLWFDLDGPHFGPPPSTAPGATHLWAWNGDTALLARLENSRVVAGLTLHRAPANTEGAITAQPRRMVPWPTGEHRIGTPPDGIAHTTLVTLEIDGPLELLADDRWLQRGNH